MATTVASMLLAPFLAPGPVSPVQPPLVLFAVHKYLSGATYTQTTDVENEVNGFLSYDRWVFKMALPTVAERIRALSPRVPIRATVVDGGGQCASADQFAMTASAWIPELKAVREKLQRSREVVGCHVNHVGVQRIIIDR
jgi:hypothetical protein